MGECELCGREGPTFPAIIGGVKLHVCKHCLSFGKPIKQTKPIKRHISKNKPVKEEKKTVLLEDYPQRIKNARKSKGWDVEEFAKQLFEKKSVISKIEAGDLIPSDKLVSKIEHLLKIKIHKEVESEETPKKIELHPGEAFTLGQIAIKKK